MQVFDHANYLVVLQEVLAENAGIRGYKSSMARAMGCQASYLSQVLVGKVNITPEQALALADFWNFEELETEFFLTLVNYERAGTERLRRRLRKAIEELREKSYLFRSQHRGNVKPLVKVNPEDAIFYWSNWECTAIFEYLKLPEARKLSQIAQRFHLPLEFVGRLLERMKRMGLVEVENDLWKAAGEIEISVDEIGLIQSFHRAMRDRANYRLITPETMLMTFTLIGGISKSDLHVVSNLLREMTVKAASLQKESQAEELVSLCVDFYLV